MELQVVSIPDNEIFAVLEKFTQELPESARVGNFNFDVIDGPDISVPFAQAASNPQLQYILTQSGECLRRCTLGFSIQNVGCRVGLVRGNDGRTVVSLDLPNDLGQEWRPRLVVAFRHGLKPYLRANTLAEIHPILEEFYNRREEGLVRLEELAKKVILDADQQRRTIEADAQAARKEQDRAHQERVTLLEKQYQDKASELEQRAAELGERAKQLDDRDNTHARRALHKSLKEEFQKRSTNFALTKDTSRKRLPVAGAFGFLGLVTAIIVGFALWGTMHALPVGVPFWMPLLRLGMSLAAFTAAVIFYVRWQDRWSDAHAEEEFRLKRLDLDVDRASWLVEVMLEWQRENQGEMPSELLEQLSAGLFEQPGAHGGLRHPVEDVVAAILSGSAGMKLKLANGEVTLDRKGLQAAKNQAAGS